MTRRSSALITVGALIVASCGGDSSSPTAPSSSFAPSSSSVTRTLTGITISAAVIELTVAETITLTATASYSDGTSTQLSSAAWSSNDELVASVNAQGTVTGHARGTATITATYDDESAEASVNVTLASRSVEARFEDTIWRDLVYNQHDYPDTIDGRVSYVLNPTSPNLYIRMGDPTGRRVVSFQRRDHMRKTFPRLVQQMTGEPYRGSIEDGISDRKQSGWITVRFVTYEEEPAISEGACGRASVGASMGNIWVIRRARGNKNCVDDSFFPHIFAHEVGHALGFFHVSDQAAVMTPGWSNFRETFSSGEQYHGRLAYEIGRGAPYIGWPLSLLATGFDQRRGSLSPIFIID